MCCDIVGLCIHPHKMHSSVGYGLMKGHICALAALGILMLMYAESVHSQSVRVVFWNVENFFDTRNDSLKNDDSFTPAGENHWNERRFRLKRDNIFKVLVSLGAPDIVGLAEVENDFVLEQLCYATPLRKFDYGFIHYDSPDARGIDCAVLYRRSAFSTFFSKNINISDSTELFFTRDILLVGGVTANNDSLYLLVCHLPSKLGGDYAERQRNRIAGLLRHTVDTVANAHPRAAVIVMGDFNADPYEATYQKSFGFDGSKTNPEKMTNLMYDLVDGEGSHNYGGRWSYLDQFMVRPPRAEGFVMPTAMVYKPEFLLEPDVRHQTSRPFRTYRGLRYIGGYSDHLPVYLDLTAW